MSRYCRNFTALSSFFDVKKQKPKTNLGKSFLFLTTLSAAHLFTIRGKRKRAKNLKIALGTRLLFLNLPPKSKHR